MGGQPPIGVLGLYDTPNFGDLLLADLIADAIVEGGGTPQFVLGYKPLKGSVMRKKLCGLLKSFRCRAVMLGGGGYLEAAGRSVITKLGPITIVAALASLLGRRVAIFGAGCGPGNSGVANAMVSILCRLSEPLKIRDAQSIAALKAAGVKRNIFLCVDLAHVVVRRGRYKDLFKYRVASDKKTIIIHADAFFLRGMSDVSATDFFKIVSRWQTSYSGRIKLLFDYLDEEFLAPWDSELRKFETLAGLGVQEVLAELWNSDVIVSGKFHIALVGFTLGKPVYSFAKHAKVKDLFARLDISNNYCSGSMSSADFELLLEKAGQASWEAGNEKTRESFVNKADELYQDIVNFTRECSHD
jgi:polysaccharide pyruvyl transferase WcaK-like protein